MADVDNLVLEHLRHIGGQIDRVETKVDDLILRAGHIERSVAQHSVQLADVNGKLDRLDARVTRIEKRLDLVES